MCLLTLTLSDFALLITVPSTYIMLWSQIVPNGQKWSQTIANGRRHAKSISGTILLIVGIFESLG